MNARRQQARQAPPKPRFSMSREDRRLLVFALMAIGALVLIGIVNLVQSGGGGPRIPTISYSQFLDRLGGDQVLSVTMQGNAMVGVLKDETPFRTYAADDPTLVAALRQHNVAVTAVPPPAAEPSLNSALLSLLPILLFGGILIWFMLRQNRMSRAGGTLGKSRARLLTEQAPVTFADVAGVEEAKDSLREIVEFLRDPQKFERLGGRIPRGVLLVGPPGSGKTLLARAVAGEADVPFYSISGSDFVEMFVGIGASRVRDMFAEAKKNAPCIIFMDEIDAVGRHRGAGLGQGNDEREQTLNALLVEMDGFEANQGIILIAATNRPDVLDPALVRSGRFDREVVVDNPDVLGREQILAVHVRKVPLEPDTDLKIIAKGTPGFSGADLMNLVNEAALLAVRRQKSTVGARELEDAKDKVMMGDERRSHIMSDEEKRLTAYREGGRAIVALSLPAADRVHRASIIPRGRAIGGVIQLPEGDQHATSLRQMLSRLAILMSGRAAEELVFGRDEITSGAADDIEAATALARTMVTRYGLSETLGPVAYAENEDEVFLGHSVARQQNVSEDDMRAIATEVRRLIETALAEAKRILGERRTELDTLARALVEHETLSGAEIADLVGLPAKAGASRADAAQ